MLSPRAICPVRGHTGTAESTGRGADQWGRERPDQRAVLDAVGRETKPAARHLPDRRSHYKGNLWNKAAALPGGRFVCFEEGENHSPWAIMAVEIFLKAAMSLPAIRSYPRPYSSAAAAEAS